MSLTFSTVYGNKIRKLWKVLAKADMLTNNSYDFRSPNKCKVKMTTIFCHKVTLNWKWVKFGNHSLRFILMAFCILFFLCIKSLVILFNWNSLNILLFFLEMYLPFYIIFNLRLRTVITILPPQWTCLDMSGKIVFLCFGI